MPRYQRAQTFDFVRSVRGAQSDIRGLQVLTSGKVRKNVNQLTASLVANSYFWGMDSTGWTANNGSFAIVSDPPAGARFPYAALYTNNGIAAGNFIASSAYFGIPALQQLYVSAWVNSTASSVQIGLSWLNAFLGTVTGPTNPSITVTPGTWTFISATLTAPATAVVAAPFVGSPSADGAVTYIQAVTAVPASVGAGTWQDMRPLSNSFVGTISGQYPPQYRLNSDGTVEVVGWVQFPASGGPNFNSVTFATLPAAYRPNSNAGHRWPIALSTNVAPVGTPNVQIDTSGNLQFHNCPASGMASNLASINGRYSLDSSGLILS